ncbi:MAG: hypothetical protein WC423_12350 [Vulcanimicrobiota bacterium]
MAVFFEPGWSVPTPGERLCWRSLPPAGGGAYEEVVASPEVLLKALEVGEIQAVYGQIVEGSVLSKQAPMSRPYHTLYPNFSRQTPSGEEALEAGGVKPGEGMDALWLRVHSPYRVDAGSPYEIELSELEPTGRKPDLPEQRLVFLVRPGEHRFLLELDKFLLSGSSGSNE